MRTLYQTPTVTVGRLDWAIFVIDDPELEEKPVILPRFRHTGGPWKCPSDYRGPVPGCVLLMLFERDVIMKIARVIETAMSARTLVP